MEDKESQSPSKKVIRELTPDLWGEIGKRLPDTIDIQMFRSTSKTFRNRVPSPFPCIFPFKVPPLTCVSSDPRMNFYIIEHTGYLIESERDINPGFLVFENKPKSNGRDFFAFRLFANDDSSIKLKRIWPRPKNLDMNQLPLSAVFKTYYLHYRSTAVTEGIGENYIAQKIVVLSYFRKNNQCITNFNPQFAMTEPGVNLVVIVLLKDGSLSYVFLNRRTRWKSLANLSRFDDIINYGGQLWGVDTDGGAYVMGDKVAGPPICISKITRDSWLEGRKRFVESSGKLYMLYPFSLIKDESVSEIMVFGLTSKKGCRGAFEWIKVDSIGDRAFFVGHGFSFSIVVGEELSTLFRNDSIYLNALSFHQYTLPNKKFPLFNEMRNPVPSIGVYSLMDKKFTHISPDDCPPIYCTLHH